MPAQRIREDKIDIADLYPKLSAEQKAEAAAYLARYIDVICRIYDRTQDLTGLDRRATIRSIRT